MGLWALTLCISAAYPSSNLWLGGCSTPSCRVSRVVPCLQYARKLCCFSPLLHNWILFINDVLERPLQLVGRLPVYLNLFAVVCRCFSAVCWLADALSARQHAQRRSRLALLHFAHRLLRGI